MLWLDCDDEGENIAQEVVDVCAPAARRGLRMYVSLADHKFLVRANSCTRVCWVVGSLFARATYLSGLAN